MSNIYCCLKLKNLAWAISYVKKNFSAQFFNISIQSSSSILIKYFVHKLFKKHNINSIKIITNKSFIKKKTLNIFTKYYKNLNHLIILLDCPSLNNKQVNLLEKSLLPIVIINNENKYIFNNVLQIKNEDELKSFNYYCSLNNIPLAGCEFTSCVGNTFFIMEKSVSYCYKNDFEGIITPTTIEDDIAHDPEFLKKIAAKVEIRNNCKKTCSFFKFCKGGCLYDDLCRSDIFSSFEIKPKNNKSIIFKDIYLNNKINNEK